MAFNRITHQSFRLFICSYLSISRWGNCCWNPPPLSSTLFWTFFFVTVVIDNLPGTFHFLTEPGIFCCDVCVCGYHFTQPFNWMRWQVCISIEGGRCWHVNQCEQKEPIISWRRGNVRKWPTKKRSNNCTILQSTMAYMT